MESVPKTSAHPGTCTPYACPSQSLSPATAVQSRDHDRTPCSVWFYSFDGKIKLPSEKPGTTAVMTDCEPAFAELAQCSCLLGGSGHSLRTTTATVSTSWCQWSFQNTAATLSATPRSKPGAPWRWQWGEAHIRFLAPVCEKPLALGLWDIPG